MNLCKIGVMMRLELRDEILNEGLSYKDNSARSVDQACYLVLDVQSNKIDKNGLW